MKRILAFVLIFTLLLPNTVFASYSVRYNAQETDKGQKSGGGNTANNSNTNSSSNNKTPANKKTNNPSGNTSKKPSSGSGNSNNSSNKSVKMGRLPEYSKTPHHTVIPSSTNKKINQNTKNFLANPSSTAQSFVVGSYEYIIGDLNNYGNYDLWKVIKGEHRQSIQRTDSKKTVSTWRSKHFDWTVTGGKANFSTPTKGAGNTITFLAPGTYKIRAVETLERDNYEQGVVRVRVTASHNGAILRDYTETGERIKTGTETATGKVTNWTLVIGPEDVGKPIQVDKNTGGGPGGPSGPGGSGTNKLDDIDFEVELVE